MKKNPSKKTCHKVGYKTPAEARQALNQFGRARGSVRFYKCPHCVRAKTGRPYHLTSESR